VRKSSSTAPSRQHTHDTTSRAGNVPSCRAPRQPQPRSIDGLRLACRITDEPHQSTTEHKSSALAIGRNIAWNLCCGETGEARRNSCIGRTSLANPANAKPAMAVRPSQSGQDNLKGHKGRPIAAQRIMAMTVRFSLPCEACRPEGPDKGASCMHGTFSSCLFLIKLKPSSIVFNFTDTGHSRGGGGDHFSWVGQARLKVYNRHDPAVLSCPSSLLASPSLLTTQTSHPFVLLHLRPSRCVSLPSLAPPWLPPWLRPTSCPRISSALPVCDSRPHTQFMLYQY
jgi:hypothetical protein